MTNCQKVYRGQGQQELKYVWLWKVDTHNKGKRRLSNADARLQM